jgi:hypothetical protein
MAAWSTSLSGTIRKLGSHLATLDRTSWQQRHVNYDTISEVIVLSISRSSSCGPASNLGHYDYNVFGTEKPHASVSSSGISVPVIAMYEVNLPPGGFTLDIDEVEGTVAHVSAMGCRLP